MGDEGDPPTGAAKLDLIAKLLLQARLAAWSNTLYPKNLNHPSVLMHWELLSRCP